MITTLVLMLHGTFSDRLGGKGNVIILEGVKGSTTSDERVRGFHKALTEFPNVKVLASQPANYQRLQALQVTEKSDPDQLKH
ncbi:substrate-binding domain-containing protein [Undibacterium arcticum]